MLIAQTMEIFSRRFQFMKAKRLLAISASVLTAAWITADAGMTLAQTSNKDSKVNPSLNPSVGASQSERTGSDNQTPLPEKSPMTGTVEKGSGSTKGSSSSGTTTKGTSQPRTKDDKTIHPDLNESVGGSKSERSSGGTPLPEKSPMTGTVEKGSGSSR
jgi:hypothetical protein